jgi:hypothetical protein
MALKGVQLQSNLVGRQKIVCIQPLNKIALTEKVSQIPGAGRTFIVLRINAYTF